MKKIFIPCLLIPAALTAVSCEEFLKETEPSSCTVKASAVQECIMTKVQVDMVNGKMTWQPSDTIAVCTGREFKPFTPDSTGISVSDFSGGAALSSITDCAVYPWSCNPRFEGGNSLRITLPHEISFRSNIIDAPMYAPADEWETYGIFYFKQLGGILRATLPLPLAADVAKVTIQAGGMKLCGDFDIIRDNGTPSILTSPCTGPDSLLTVTFPDQKREKNIYCPLPSGKYGKLTMITFNAAGDTLGTYKSEQDVTIKRGCVHQAQMIGASIADRFCPKVTASRTDWSGDYLLVAENAGKAYVMVTDRAFADAKCPVVIVEMSEGRLPESQDLSRCILKVTPHKADASGTGPTRDQGGKYSLLIQDGRGIGRYARTEFGFNNNVDYGRFVNSISINADKSMNITCTTKKDGESVLRFNLTGNTFGFALSGEKSSAGYLPVYFYELN